MDFVGVLTHYRTIVWQEIENYLQLLAKFPSFCQPPKKYSSLVKFHQKLVADYPQRQGKYLRPTLVLLTAGAMGFPIKKAIKTAAAMQISEDWILNHDDIEDDSRERRGKPTLHRIYGKNLAINAGDSLHNLMWKVLIDNSKILGSKKASQIQEEFYQMLHRTIFGQTVEIKWIEKNKLDFRDKDVFFISESKTVYYTVAGPMRLGAILADASEKQLDLIYKFAQPLGQAFQLRDDLLDLTSDFAGLKKQQGNDIYEGKRTVMLGHLLRTIDIKEKQKLIKILSKRRKEKSQQEVDWVIKMMTKYGSLAYGQKLAGQLAFKAKEIFQNELDFLSHQPFRDELLAGIDFMVKREY
jgi:geranylgeranyl diphosphate synthase type II